ncbi:hypothetical protein MIMGU_mgv1a021383mg, partial [Erythranthe guttata]
AAALLSGANLHFNHFRLLGLRRRALVHHHSQHPVLANSRHLLLIRIIRQFELLKHLPKSPLHLQILDPFFLIPPPPLPTDDQNVVVFEVDLNLVGLQPRHVHHEVVRIRELDDVGRCRFHGFVVADEGARRVLRLLGVVDEFEHVVYC